MTSLDIKRRYVVRICLSLGSLNKCFVISLKVTYRLVLLTHVLKEFMIHYACKYYVYIKDGFNMNVFVNFMVASTASFRSIYIALLFDRVCYVVIVL